MATAAQIIQVRLNINDEDETDFTDAQITIYIDEESSVNYASWKLIDILIVRLRKEILKCDTTGAESTEFMDLKQRMDLLIYLSNKYKKDYDNELGFGTGRFISTTKPTISGGDV